MSWREARRWRESCGTDREPGGGVAVSGREQASSGATSENIAAISAPVTCTSRLDATSQAVAWKFAVPPTLPTKAQAVMSGVAGQAIQIADSSPNVRSSALAATRGGLGQLAEMKGSSSPIRGLRHR